MNKKNIILIGNKESKRYTYYEKAMDKNIHSFIAMEWDNINVETLKKADLVKIEPPIINKTEVNYLDGFIKWYYEKLDFLHGLENVKYLNSPKAIKECLDKAYTKKLLIEAGIACVQMIGYDINNYDEFISLINENNINEVFIKPKYGSGACGIIAYKRNKTTNQEIIYSTSSLGYDGYILNNKKTTKEQNSQKIKELINAICKVGVIIEKWEIKDTYEKLTYDLRVVYQFGKIEHIVARGSKGPITNLHLNNKPIEFEKLNFTDQDINDINNICAKTIKCFSGLNVFGIDILVTKNREFKVIEVNSQGDLIHKDIYKDNLIYRNQIKNMLGD